MTFKASLLYAARLLKPSKQSSSNGRKSLFGAIFGIALSIVPLVVVLIVSDGMIEGITSRIIGLSNYHLQVVQTRQVSLETDEHISFLQTMQEKLKSIDGVEDAFLERQGIALAVGKNGRTGATIRAVEKDLFDRNKDFKYFVDVIDGMASFPTDKSVVIGKKIAETLELSVGDTIRLMTTKTLSNGNISPKMISCKISGIVSSGYEEIDGLWVFMPLETGFDYLSSASSQIKIGLVTDDPFSSSFAKTAIDTMQAIPSQFFVYRWDDLNSSQFENYASTKMLLLLVMFLILLIAAVNISAALIMTALERQKEIAILKSLGATSKGISLSFIIAGLFCGLGGVIIGLPIGLLIGLTFNEILHGLENITNGIMSVWHTFFCGAQVESIQFLDPAFYLETVPVRVPVAEVVLIIGGTIVLSMLVSFVPAFRAGKERPLELLRKI